MNDGNPCGCSGGQEETVDAEIKKALLKFKKSCPFNNLTKLGDLGLSDKQLSVLLYYLEGKFKLNLGCPIPIEKCKELAIIEIKTKINEYGNQKQEGTFH